MTKKMQQNIFLLVLVTGGLGYVYFTYLLTPLENRFKDQVKALQQKESKVAEMKKRALELPKLQAEMKLLEEEVAELEKLLPREKEIPGLLRIVTRTAQRYQIKISNISPGGVIAQPNYNELPFNITLQGTYHSLGNFLAEIGQESRILSIRNVNLTANPVTKDNASSVSVTLTLVAYTFKVQ